MKQLSMSPRGRKWMFLMTALLLIGLAMLQAFLVFGESNLQSYTEKETEAEPWEATILTPGSLYVSLGGEEAATFRIPSLTEEEKKAITAQAASLLARLAEEAEMEEVPLEELPMGDLCLVMKFLIRFDTEFLEEELDKELDWEMAFSLMYICPSTRQGEPVRFYLLDSETETVLLIRGGDREWQENLALYTRLLELGTESLAEQSPLYLDAGFVFEDRYAAGSFVREASERETVYSGEVQPAFYVRGDYRSTLMNAYAEGFFDYPDSVTRTEVEGGWCFSDEKVVVRIDEEGYLQYRSTLTAEEKTEKGAAAAYRVALDFLEADMARLSSDITAVLADYERTEAGYTFYFDYYVQGIRLDLSEKLGEGSSSYPVRIKVQGETVQECDRYLLCLTLQEDSGRLVKDSWLSIADRAASLESESPEEGSAGTDSYGVPVLIYQIKEDSLVARWYLPAVEEGVEDRYLAVLAE